MKYYIKILYKRLKTVALYVTGTRISKADPEVLNQLRMEQGEARRYAV